jgi:hypothetical protein
MGSMSNETPEMVRYNEICAGYEDAVLACDYARCLAIVLQTQEYLDTLSYHSHMYRNGNKWTVAGDLMAANITRLFWLRRITGGKSCES